jgi:hypothetical protein
MANDVLGILAKNVVECMDEKMISDLRRIYMGDEEFISELKKKWTTEERKDDEL